MSDSKKKRLSMLDSLSSAGSAPSAGSGLSSMMQANRALRSARDAVDGHRIWELDPEQVVDLRRADRLDVADVADLRSSIETNGQTVPILVRRDPENADRYLLVYGRRRLEAIRSSGQVDKVRALIAQMGERDALRAQVSENTGRRDLSFIERALFAQELLDEGLGTQAEIAEMLNVTKSAISMALKVVRHVGPDLVRAIGPAHGVGRPRWEALVLSLEETQLPRETLIDAALSAQATEPEEAGVAAFDAVMAHLRKAEKLAKPPTPTASAADRLQLGGKPAGRVARTKSGVKLDLHIESDFAAWIESEAQDVLELLHAKWTETKG